MQLALKRKVGNYCQVLAWQNRSIYLKGTGLEKENFKEQDAEDDMVLLIFRNYLNDPKITDAEREEVRVKAKAIMEKRAAAKPTSESESQTILNPEKLKDVFDKMTEIDSDPNSQRAQQYYQSLEEQERKNKQKRSGQIIVKTMKRGGRFDVQTIEVGSDGQPLTQEEALFRRKNIDYTKVKFPEVNGVKFSRVDSKKKSLHIQNYRWPAEGKRKGIVQFVNGYGDYVGRYAYLAQRFAKHGYEFTGIDMRGHGHSDGLRGYYESAQTTIDDQIQYMRAYDQQYGGSDVPKFLVTQSLGSTIGLHMVVEEPKMFNGVSLLAPYFQLQKHRQEKIDSLLPFAKVMNYLVPTYKINVSRGIDAKKWISGFAEDPVYEGAYFRVNEIVDNKRMLKNFNEQVQEKVQTPFLMILGGRDQLVCNKASRQFFETNPIKDKDLIQYDDADHAFIQDAEFSNIVTMDIINWQNTHI